ncbi:MAG: response regulator transcription factor [Candidatus Eremiobacteraeota bacterium]|nr:response regulator transcription factor [Candidatus Eremiobacteraeota bacterium]
MRILIVEDDDRIAAPVADDLRRQRHTVDIASDGPAGLAYARTGVYEVILLDIMLPGMSGIEICRELRRERSAAMILMLTARDTTEDTVAGLDAGADDYLVKPFDLAELGARLRALGRRQFTARDNVLRSGALSLDRTELRVRCAEATVPLTPTEFALLETLMRNPMRVFSRAMLLERIVPLERTAADESIKTHVANVRRKVRAAGCTYDPIETLYGNGYRLAEPK